MTGIDLQVTGHPARLNWGPSVMNNPTFGEDTRDQRNAEWRG
jgi:hypothetical protein